MEEVVKSGVGVIVIKDDKILIGKRKGSHGAGCWSFPGGHLEIDDPSMKNCGEREVLEETGMVCHVYSPDGFREELFTAFGSLGENGSKVYTTVYLVAEYLHGGTIQKTGNLEPSEPDKCEFWRWVTIDELVELVNYDDDGESGTRSWIPLNQVIHYMKEQLS